jgi:hypothetical protein
MLDPLDPFRGTAGVSKQISREAVRAELDLEGKQSRSWRIWAVMTPKWTPLLMDILCAIDAQPLGEESCAVEPDERIMLSITFDPFGAVDGLDMTTIPLDTTKLWVSEVP